MYYPLAMHYECTCVPTSVYTALSSFLVHNITQQRFILSTLVCQQTALSSFLVHRITQQLFKYLVYMLNSIKALNMICARCYCRKDNQSLRKTRHTTAPSVVGGAGGITRSEFTSNGDVVETNSRTEQEKQVYTSYYTNQVLYIVELE